MSDYTQLQGFTNSQDATLSNILLQNFISFYDWGFIDKGGFYNTKVPASGMYGGDKHKLKPLSDPNYADGTVWQGFRGNWMWETGVSIGTPVSVSGIFINNTFRATGNVTQPYYVNYPRGQVIFNSPISVTSNVQIEYSYKWLNVVPAKGIPWFREIQQYSNRLDNLAVQNSKGQYVKLGQTTVQLPALIIDVVPSKDFKPYQLGDRTQWIHNDIIFYVITENHWECSNIMDQVVFQNDRSILLYDPNKVVESGVLPFNYRNELTAMALPSGMYPSLVENFKYKDCFIFDSNSQGITQFSPDLFMGTVKCSTEVIGT